jgi:glycosyltransferase involved in cell wall biosynthesis
VTSARPILAHVTTTDISLEWLLGPQLEAFAHDGFDVVGVSAPGPFVDALERRGVRHVGLRHATRSFAPFADARVVRELANVFRALRPTIVHTHNPKPGLYGRLAARSARVPIVVNTVHGLYAQQDDRIAKRAVVYTAERVASMCSHAELVQNVEDLAALRRLGVPERKLTLLGNGIDLGRFDPAAVTNDDRCAARAELGARGADDVVVASVGRLVREKGFLELFAAAARVREHTPATRFAVIGGADPDKADALGADELAAAAAAGVHVLGERDDIVRLYAAMDIFVLPSYREGFPRAAMEATAMGVPVIATRIRGCRQVVDDGVTGILVPPRDVDALTGAIERLLRDPESRRRMGAAGRGKARHAFDQQRCIDITLDTYRRLLDARTPPAKARAK